NSQARWAMVWLAWLLVSAPLAQPGEPLPRVAPWASSQTSPWAPLLQRLLRLRPPRPSSAKASRQALRTQAQSRQAAAISSSRAAPEPPESLRPLNLWQRPAPRVLAALHPLLRRRFPQGPCPKRSPPPKFLRERPAANKD